jgi:hypothetical protein
MNLSFPPDEYLVMRPLDALVQFAHDWGINRITVLRAFMVVALASMIVFTFLRANSTLSAGIGVGLLSVVGLAVQFKEEWQSKFRSHNAVQLTIRSGWMGWARFSIFMALFLPSMITDPLRYIDNVFWLLWLYSFSTLKPINPPKHHWRELIPAAFKTAPGAV